MNEEKGATTSMLIPQAGETINTIRSLSSDECRSFEKYQKIAQVVIDTISQTSDLWHSDMRTYLTIREANTIIEVNKENVKYLNLMSGFKLNPTEKEFSFTTEELKTHIRQNGDLIRFKTDCHFDAESFKAYIDCHDGRMVRVAREAINVIDNGTDGVLFKENEDAEPFRLVGVNADEDPIGELIINRANFSDGILTREQLRLLFRYLLFSMIFRSTMYTRPIAVFKGEKGSAKTSTLKLIGYLFMGSKFSVMQMTQDSKDFDAAVSNSPYIVIDNVDTFVKWLFDRLAILATGGSLKKRELYTTNKLTTIPLDCFVFITSREPKFLRDDVADRILLFNVDRLKSFIPEKHLRASVLNNRDKLMSHVVVEVQKILKALHNQRDYEVTTAFRIADFAEFFIKVMRDQGRQEEAEEILKRMSSIQHNEVVKSDPLLRLLKQWVPNNVGREVLARDLADELEATAKAEGISEKVVVNSRSLGRRLNELMDVLSEDYDVVQRTGGQRRVYYSFSIRKHN